MKVSAEEIMQWLNPPSEDTSIASVRTVSPMTVDVKQVSKDFNVTEEVAKVALDELYTTVKKLLPGESDDVYDYVVMQKIGEKFKTATSGGGLEYAKEKGAKEFNVVVLGISKAKDQNEFNKRKCWTAFKEDPNAALTAGLVTLSAEKKPIPMDNKRTFDNGEANPNFGKPIAYKRSVDMIVSMDGDIYLARGDVDGVHVGYKTTFYGGVTMTSKDKPMPYKGVIKVWKNAVEEDGAYPNTWKVAEKLADTDYFKELHEVRELPSWGMFATKGYVQRIDVQDVNAKDGSTYKKGAVFVSGSDDLKGIKFSTSYGPTVEYLNDASKVDEGDEVIVLGERQSFKNDKGEYIPYNVLIGIIKNDSGSNKFADALKKMNKAMSA